MEPSPPTQQEPIIGSAGTGGVSYEYRRDWAWWTRCQWETLPAVAGMSLSRCSNSPVLQRQSHQSQPHAYHRQGRRCGCHLLPDAIKPPSPTAGPSVAADITHPSDVDPWFLYSWPRLWSDSLYRSGQRRSALSHIQRRV
jgi:hypothetical protein